MAEMEDAMASGLHGDGFAAAKRLAVLGDDGGEEQVQAGTSGGGEDEDRGGLQLGTGPMWLGCGCAHLRAVASRNRARARFEGTAAEGWIFGGIAALGREHDLRMVAHGCGWLGVCLGLWNWLKAWCGGEVKWWRWMAEEKLWVNYGGVGWVFELMAEDCSQCGELVIVVAEARQIYGGARQ
ncbi:hypothetical protein M0R45_007157 [Rubus argutus]|uniref:Uncharacterized protein n=1 Tax=Rubus argutus TaxID=59490 RepID=A0AAW1YSL6_RUBAR